MSTQKFQGVRGMNDVLPASVHLWEALEDILRDWLKSYGYQSIRTPLLEPTGLFARSIGEVTDIVEKEMYSFTDTLNGEALTLRPEATAATVRAVIEHNLLYPGPQRLCYLGPMFRHERPQKGRYRQFHQCGVEALGYAGPEIDAELIFMTARLWSRLGLPKVRLLLNSIGSLEARQRYRVRLIDYFEGHRDHLDEEAARRLHTNPMRLLDSKHPAMQSLIAGAPVLMDDLDEASLSHFEKLTSFLQSAGIAYEIAPRLVRGLDYYNATVFEWVTDALGAQGTICGGGRYDGLMEQLGGKPAPAAGFAMGIERLLALRELAEVAPSPSAPLVYIAVESDAQMAFALQVGERLREAGVHATLHAGGGTFKSQFKRADASGARVCAVIGAEEAGCEEVSLKPLRGQGDQIRVKIEVLVASVQGLS